MDDLKSLIIDYRAKAKMSQRQFAEMCGLHFNTIVKIEHGGNVLATTEAKIRQKMEERK